jgi:hypothetical protein
LDAASEGLGDEWWALLWWEFVWLVWLTIPEYSSQTSGQEIASKVTRGTMVGENRRSLSANGVPLMAGPNFQPSDDNPTVISILRQLADGLENVPEM